MQRKQGVRGFMALKIDFEKAYDRLRRSFIRDTLTQMNLPILLVNVIMECVTSASLRVIWNGEPSQRFHPSRGIRQGDPLSPYLFVMCMERLYQTIEEQFYRKDGNQFVLAEMVRYYQICFSHMILYYLRKLMLIKLL